MARKLRIAVSVFLGLLTVALCVLWVRSYWRLDQVVRSDSTVVVVYSNNGHLGVTQTGPWIIPHPHNHWMFASTNADDRYPTSFRTSTPTRTTLSLSHLPLALTAAAIAIASWAPGRFSLRTLLIAMTLVAIVLGLGVWLTR